LRYCQRPVSGGNGESGGLGWTCLLTEAGAELVELGPLG
jgi:hypothetical protein